MQFDTKLLGVFVTSAELPNTSSTRSTPMVGDGETGPQSRYAYSWPENHRPVCSTCRTGRPRSAGSGLLTPQLCRANGDLVTIAGVWGRLAAATPVHDSTETADHRPAQ